MITSVAVKLKKMADAVVIPAQVYKFSYRTGRLPYCCGVTEVGEFCTNMHTKAQIERSIGTYNHAEGWYPTMEEAHKGALTYILNNAGPLAVQFWFYKSCDYKGSFDDQEYTEKGFREVVRAHPGVIELAEYVNPNSNNMINGYMILNDVTQIAKSDEEDEDDDNY